MTSSSSVLAPELLEVLVAQAVRRGRPAEEAARDIEAQARQGNLDAMQQEYARVLARIDDQMLLAAERASQTQA